MWGKASNPERYMKIWRGHRGLIVTIGLVAVVVGAWWFWEHVAAFAGWLDGYVGVWWARVTAVGSWLLEHSEKFAT